MNTVSRSLLAFIIANVSLPLFGLRLPLPSEQNDVAGHVTTGVVATALPFPAVARQYDVGFFELLEANPNINPDKLVPGTVMIVPTQFILPPTQRKGIVINLGAMRLYYFPKNKDYFYTYPIGIGKENWETPVGKLSIIEKIKNPVWFVPQSIYEFRKKAGDPVPRVVKPGKDNPLGLFALRLSKPTYLIHDTNDPTSVGVRSSAGCIHLYPEDIKELFDNVSVNESVVIINQPYTLGWNNNDLLLEAHLPLVEVRNQYAAVTARIHQLSADTPQQGAILDEIQATNAINDHLGIPSTVGHVSDPLASHKPTLLLPDPVIDENGKNAK